MLINQICKSSSVALRVAAINNNFCSRNAARSSSSLCLASTMVITAPAASIGCTTRQTSFSTTSRHGNEVSAAPSDQLTEIESNVLTFVTDFIKATPSSSFTLSFKQYLSAKGKLRTQQRVSGAVTAILSGVGTAIVSPPALEYFYPGCSENPEFLIMDMMDPIVFTGLTCVVMSATGFGIGSACWKFFKSRGSAYEEYRVRDQNFLQRLESRRTGFESEFNDDFYGESIRTLSDYRQWCRTQDGKRKLQNEIDHALKDTVVEKVKKVEKVL